MALPRVKVRCPQCRAWVDWDTQPTRPFCSVECRRADLGKWATEQYRIPQPLTAEDAPPTAETTPDSSKDEE